MQSEVTDMSYTSDIPVSARSLGFWGLMPFLLLGLSLWFLEGDLAQHVTFGLVAYGAVILSFLGGIHWGLAVPGLLLEDQQGEDPVSRRGLVLSVLPSLIAWLGVLLWQSMAGFICLVGGFVMVLAMDISAGRDERIPSWFLDLRKLLTIIVLVCLVNAALFSRSIEPWPL